MKKLHLLMIILLIVFGSLTTTFLALQNMQTTQDAYPNTNFFHPFIQTAFMFIGESVCIIMYLVNKRFYPQIYMQMKDPGKQQCPWYLPMIPGVMALMSSILGYIALSLVDGSVWQMTRASVIITTAIFSKIFLKKNFTKSSVFGCVLAFFGIMWVQLCSILFKRNSGSDQRIHTPLEQFIGFMLLLVSLLFTTVMYISEKMIFDKYSIHPFKMVFLQGVYGFIGIVIVISTISFYNCPQDSSIKQKCMYYNGQYYIESVYVFYKQISTNILPLNNRIWLFIKRKLLLVERATNRSYIIEQRQTLIFK